VASSDKKKQSSKDSSLFGTFKEKNLDIVVAALLLTGRLRVDSIQLFRDASMIVGLVGKYKTISGLNTSNVEKMVDFLNKNGSMTLDEVIEAIGQKAEKR